jgi:hypothetical protein
MVPTPKKDAIDQKPRKILQSRFTPPPVTLQLDEAALVKPVCSCMVLADESVGVQLEEPKKMLLQYDVVIKCLYQSGDALSHLHFFWKLCQHLFHE